MTYEVHMSSIGERIREIRGKISQEKFAERTGINKSTLGRYERGINSPDSNAISSICKAFHVNSEWLFTGKGKTFSDDIARYPDTSTEIGLDEERLGNEIDENITLSIVKIDNKEYNHGILVPLREAFLETLKANSISITKKKFDLISLILYEEFLYSVMQYTGRTSYQMDQLGKVVDAQKNIAPLVKQQK